MAAEEDEEDAVVDVDAVADVESGGTDVAESLPILLVLPLLLLMLLLRAGSLSMTIADCASVHERTLFARALTMSSPLAIMH